MGISALTIIFFGILRGKLKSEQRLCVRYKNYSKLLAKYLQNIMFLIPTEITATAIFWTTNIEPDRMQVISSVIFLGGNG